MKISLGARILAGLLLFVTWQVVLSSHAGAIEKVSVRWDKVIRVSRTTPTLQVVAMPPLRPGSPIRERAFRALRELDCDFVRYGTWHPYPKLGVAMLEPPAGGKTSWDFSLIDPITAEFLEATRGRSTVVNLSTIPQWMFVTEKPVPYPAEPDQVTWTYSQGTALRDPSMKEVADYYARVVSWYTQGGFTDEFGKRHESGHRYEISHWEVLNEIDLEHGFAPETYTRLYDAVVDAIRRVNPDIKFVGLALAGTCPVAGNDVAAYFEYFLNRANHRPGIPLDMISYHFYSIPTPDQTLEVQEHTFFEQADAFLRTAQFIEKIRERLSPATQTAVNEIGTISTADSEITKQAAFTPLPDVYWNLSAAVFAYVYSGLARLGIEVAAQSQLVGYPGQFPSVTMLDWTTGQPNARYWVLKLIRENFGPGDKLVETVSSLRYVHSQAFVTRDGKRKVLLVNKRDRAFELEVPLTNGGQIEYVDQTTGSHPPATSKLTENQVKLAGYAVAIVTLSD